LRRPKLPTKGGSVPEEEEEKKKTKKTKKTKKKKKKKKGGGGGNTNLYSLLLKTIISENCHLLQALCEIFSQVEQITQAVEAPRVLLSCKPTLLRLLSM